MKHRLFLITLLCCAVLGVSAVVFTVFTARIAKATRGGENGGASAEMPPKERIVHSEESYNGTPGFAYAYVYADGKSASVSARLERVPASVTEFVIPDGVETIGYAAFSGCPKLERVSLPDSLETIAIPESVKTIRPVAFEECPCAGTVRRTMESRGLGNAYGVDDDVDEETDEDDE